MGAWLLSSCGGGRGRSAGPRASAATRCRAARHAPASPLSPLRRTLLAEASPLALTLNGLQFTPASSPYVYEKETAGQAGAAVDRVGLVDS